MNFIFYKCTYLFRSSCTRFSVVGTYKKDGEKHIWAGQITHPGQVSYLDSETVNANYLNQFSEFQVVTPN